MTANLRAVRPDELVPPHDLAAEAAVLSAVLLDRAAITRVKDFLRAEHFYSGKHRLIFSAAEALDGKGEPIDITTVASWLRAKGRDAQVGGHPGIGDILDATPAPANVRAHALAVHAMWRRRQISVACRRADARVQGDVEDVQGFADELVRSFAKIAGENPLRPVEGNREALAAIVADALGGDAANDTPSVNEARGFPTKLWALDRIFWGFRPAAMTTVAATTGVGKTAFAFHVARIVAHAGGEVLFFSTELRRRELLRRGLAAESLIPNEKIKRRTLERLEVSALMEASRRLEALPLRIDETARLTVEELRSIANAHAEHVQIVNRRPLAMVVVDYVQRLATSRCMFGRKEYEQIQHAARELKIMAQDLNVSVLALAQAKGDDDTKARKKRPRPTLEGGIAGSKGIAKESDEVIFLYAPVVEDRVPDLEIEAILAKQRDGRTGSVDLMFHRDTSTFEDVNDPMRCGSRSYLDTFPEPPAAEPEWINPLTEGL